MKENSRNLSIKNKNSKIEGKIQKKFGKTWKKLGEKIQGTVKKNSKKFEMGWKFEKK